VLQKTANRLSSILRTDVRYIFSGGFFLSLTQVSSAFISLGMTIAFANLISPETYGLYRYMLSIYALITIFAFPGLDTAVAQSVSNGFDRSLIEGFKTKFKWSIMGTVASFGVAGYYFLNGNQVLAAIFAIMGAALPFMESPSLITSFLNGKKLFKTWATMDIGGQLISAACLVTTIFLTKNILLIVMAYFLPYIVVRMGWYIWIKKNLIKNREIDSGLFKYGGSVTIFQILSRAAASIDQIVLFHILGPAQVAIFSLAQAVPNRIQSLFRIVGTLALPKFAERSPKEIASVLPRKLLLFGVIILAGCLLYVMLAPLLFKYIFPKYLASLSYSQVLVFYTLSAVTYPFGSYLFAHKKLKESYIVSSSSIIIKIASLAIFVPIIGIWGAVVGTLTSSAVIIILSFYFLKRDMSLHRT